jgi:hypothetical protein
MVPSTVFGIEILIFHAYLTGSCPLNPGLKKTSFYPNPPFGGKYFFPYF